MESMLGVSSMIHSYCRYHPTCNLDTVVNDILQRIVSRLGDNCRLEDGSTESIRQVVLNLKAIGNAGVLPISEEVSKMPVIMGCFVDRSNPDEVRLAAIDALRRLPCASYDNQDVINLFINVNENTEMRIKAFLTLMRCGNRQSIEMVKSMLYTEPVNQGMQSRKKDDKKCFLILMSLILQIVLFLFSCVICLDVPDKFTGNESPGEAGVEGTGFQ